MNNNIIINDPAYQNLRRSRRQIMLFCTVCCLLPLAIYIGMAILNPLLLAVPVSAGGGVSVGMAMGLVVFIISWLMTGLYTYIANSRLDELQSRIVAEARS
ncbi:DUF485 domain-containing protein [Castellaniella sp.]|uniref:DUF485 domain-containing protein n=1 Tax=Castellaniella sp. TaxID=1955812 RepID=UPI002AFEE2B8|nr:DUF485 domain-containing protein [Castellaniella sp.]